MYDASPTLLSLKVKLITLDIGEIVNHAKPVPNAYVVVPDAS